MGLYDRDYMQRGPEDENWSRRESESRRRGRARSRGWVVAAMVGLAAVAVLVLLAIPGGEDSTSPERQHTQDQLVGEESGVQVSRDGGTAGPTRRAGKPERLPLINVNSASFEELDSLPYISPAKARAIIDGRPYNRSRPEGERPCRY